jgi:hypothetical protein
MNSEDIRIYGLSDLEKRQVLYKEYCDPLMLAAKGYEREGETVKADEQWDLWTAKKLEIRTLYTD